ncbi:ACT domain-containing protein [Hymenobacter taeanensis]|uniref:ACT domain-containing protein n=1 Tax=Hymenobacter taeanensis TaxID=2735321 RepID=A0A6M6BI18_9BACT|nr:MULTISPECIES: ACT domain-containing protein [Hymenobacter]QJX47622.1 ACT domain-containing protein [Hymenobacter taeanensis]UOQ82895.1 ACT domain-containing protein [Hymenobacter sp. 5414T-23]
MPTGETNLSRLIRTMKPELQPGTYVYCTVASLTGLELTECLGMFREREGITLILPQTTADRLHLSYSFRAAWITLTVHSALEAVGLTAAFARVLALAGISCNVVAAYYHDHIFVAAEDAQKALGHLRRLAETGGVA